MLGLGKYEYQIDDKNRLRIPAKLKDSLGNEPVIMAGQDGCLQLMTAERGSIILESLRAQTKSTQSGRAVFRILQESLLNLVLDAQGRFVLTKSLLDLSKITKNVVFLSNGEFVEIWAEEVYDSFKKTIFGDTPINLSDALGDYDI